MNILHVATNNLGRSSVFNAVMEIQLLTQREREILNFLIKGLTSQEISEMLSISKPTVDTHRRNMLKKSGAKNTAELISRVIQSGILH